MKSLAPLLALLLPSAVILLVGLAVQRAARRRPRAAAIAVGATVAAGLGAIGYAGLGADADLSAGRWLAVGLALVVLGGLAALLVPAAGARGGPAATAASVKRLFGYLAACWLLATALGVLALLAAGPPGTFR